MRQSVHSHTLSSQNCYLDNFVVKPLSNQRYAVRRYEEPEEGQSEDDDPVNHLHKPHLFSLKLTQEKFFTFSLCKQKHARTLSERMQRLVGVVVVFQVPMLCQSDRKRDCYARTKLGWYETFGGPAPALRRSAIERDRHLGHRDHASCYSAARQCFSHHQLRRYYFSFPSSSIKDTRKTENLRNIWFGLTKRTNVRAYVQHDSSKRVPSRAPE